MMFWYGIITPLLVLLPPCAQPPGASTSPSTTPSSLNFYLIPPDL